MNKIVKEWQHYKRMVDKLATAEKNLRVLDEVWKMYCDVLWELDHTDSAEKLRGYVKEIGMALFEYYKFVSLRGRRITIQRMRRYTIYNDWHYTKYMLEDYIKARDKAAEQIEPFIWDLLERDGQT